MTGTSQNSRRPRSPRRAAPLKTRQQLATLAGISPRQLAYWETKGLVRIDAPPEGGWEPEAAERLAKELRPIKFLVDPHTGYGISVDRATTMLDELSRLQEYDDDGGRWSLGVYFDGDTDWATRAPSAPPGRTARSLDGAPPPCRRTPEPVTLTGSVPAGWGPSSAASPTWRGTLPHRRRALGADRRSDRSAPTPPRAVALKRHGGVPAATPSGAPGARWAGVLKETTSRQQGDNAPERTPRV
jgi:hypothetical protein